MNIGLSVLLSGSGVNSVLKSSRTVATLSTHRKGLEKPESIDH